MKTQGILGDQRFILAAILILAFTVSVVISRILLTQDQQAITAINDLASVTTALIASMLFVNLWLSTGDQDKSKKIWRQIAIGMILWTIAEAIWGFYEVILGVATPYPSLADLFWLIGYLPFYLAMVDRYRTFRSAPTQRQKLVIALTAIVFTLIVGVFVIKPTIESFDPTKILESIPNILYPLFDLILLILTLVIIFSLEQGRFGLTWQLVGVGLIFMSSADLLFAYATWNGTYNPEGQLNVITVAIDTLYYVSYLTMGLGAYTYKLTAEPLQAVKMNIVLRSMAKSNILVFVDAQGRIVSLSDNFLDLISGQTKDQYVKMPLGEVLGIDKAAVENLVTETIQRGSLSTQPLTVWDTNGNAREIWLTSFVANDELGRFMCLAMVLRTNFALQGGQERPLTQEQKMLINYYLTKAGTYRNEENQVIKTYFLEQIKLLYSLVQQFSGRNAAEKLLGHLSRVAGDNNWQFTFTEQAIGIPEEYEGQTLADRISVLLGEAKEFAVNMIDLKVVEHEMSVLDNSLSTDHLQYIDKYQLRRTAQPVA